VAALVAFLLYRPDTAAPFEIVDFSETLPILTEGQGFTDRFQGLVSYYLQHGRAAFGLSAGLAARWSLFEWWTPGWQWARFLVCLAVVVLTWRLLRLLGASRAGAAAGAGLFVVSESAAPGWLRPAVSEPFGTLLLLVASLVACRYQGTERPGRLAAAIAVLVALMILTKETLVAAAFLPAALALCRGPHGWLTWPELSRRNAVLAGALGGVLLVMAVPVLWAVSQTAPDGYARQFGAADGLLSNAVFGLLPALFPFTPIPSPPLWSVLLADIAWLTVLIVGWRALPGDAVARRHARLVLSLGLALPLARLVVYLPWPLQYPYYSIPYLLGVALLLAFAVTHLGRAARPLPQFGLIAAALAGLQSAAGSGAEAARYFASRRLSDALVSELHTLGRTGAVDSVVIAVPRVKEQAWWGLGPTLARFGTATGRPLPPVREMVCDSAQTLAVSRPRRTVLTSLRWQCALEPSGARTLHATLGWMHPARLDWVVDTLHADILADRPKLTGDDTPPDR
jgi:hypothetical protein